MKDRITSQAVIENRLITFAAYSAAETPAVFFSTGRATPKIADYRGFSIPI